MEKDGEEYDNLINKMIKENLKKEKSLWQSMKLLMKIKN